MPSSTPDFPTTATPRRAFLRGVRAGAPFILVIAPFGLLFGVVGTEAGLNLAEVMGFTVLVIAGAAQFTAVQLMADNAPTVIVLATALAVNLRMAMYSASLVPHLGAAPLWQRAFAAYGLVDQTYAASILEYDRDPSLSVPARMAYFAGCFLIVSPFWYGATLAGALVGTAIPPAFALDFAIPITFLAMIAPALRTLAHVAAAVVSISATLLLAGMPYGTGLLVAAVLAMATGAGVESMMARRT
ncbi:AzlC family ABC transporter permease [Meridianimarinicoccus sp. RP-17]|uniref:AzlC family ABC transporter permease n=1 Tax=Meridianimarinicoccus zhengii TaxID=2056810 RepID=UPI001F3C10A5|nr:AzlC family ABC transporter permease [Phycocomes zhengii]